MDENQIKALAKEVAKETVKETFLTLGVDASKPMEVQADFHFLRDCREGSEKIKSKAGLAVVGVLVTTALAALWIGIKAAFSC